jgi:prepilin-type N-terminal cleavage/methylation domain-containing protein
MKNSPQQSGFTLIELIIVILILGILASASSNILYTGFNSYFVEKDFINANWQANVALERMTRDLHVIRSQNDFTTNTTSTVLEFYNLPNGTKIKYSLDPSNSLLQRNEANGTTQVLAFGVNSINFTYHQSDGSQINLATTPLSAIRYVKITLNIVYGNTNFPITTAVYLWNIK